MGNLLGSILHGASSMRAFEQGLNVVQSNVSNAQTPGYVKQTQDFESLSFGLDKGLPGGVALGPLLSARDENAEQTVRRQQSASASADQRASDLSQIEPVFDVTEGSGVAGALSRFFNTFSQLSVAPNSNPSRQAVLDGAKSLAQSVNQSASALTTASGVADRDITNTVDGINRVLGQIASSNVEFQKRFDANKDPGLDAALHKSLEELSQFVDFTALKADDGTTTVLIGGQTPAVIGDKVYALSQDFAGSQARVLNVRGQDISGQIGGGRIGALLTTRNVTIPSYLNDLNNLASSLADSVNTALSGGLDAGGNVPATPLFTYNPANGAAQTLNVNALNPEDIAAASAAAPGGNANALALADLGRSRQVNGFTFTEFYGNLAGRVGRDVATAQNDQQSRGALLTQAKSLREASSGVSIDEEAAKLIEFQKSYQAAAKMISVLNDMLDTLMGILK